MLVCERLITQYRENIILHNCYDIIWCHYQHRVCLVPNLYVLGKCLIGCCVIKVISIAILWILCTLHLLCVIPCVLYHLNGVYVCSICDASLVCQCVYLCVHQCICVCVGMCVCMYMLYVLYMFACAICKCHLCVCMFVWTYTVITSKYDIPV